MRSCSNTILLGVSFAALMAPASAMAQSAPVAAPTDDEQVAGSTEKDIVVVGTLIRGTTAVGSQTLSVDSKAIADKGSTSTNELLALIPQIANTFNGRFEGDPRGVSAGISINKPNLRGLPSANTSSSATTLVLLNGMRLTPVGVNQAAVDADIIPAAVLEGVDALTDGGSSLYGADAVAGVLNFRTMRKFDGVKVDGNFGLGTTIKGFHEWDASITAGKSWKTGNAYISVGHSERDLILNGQTKWANGTVYNAAGTPSLTYTQCYSPVGTQTRWFRYGAGPADFTNNPLAPGAGTFPVGSACDQVSSETYSPGQKRTNVFASLSQEVADNVDLVVTAYWTKRDTELLGYPRGFTSAGSPLTTGALVGAAFPGAAIGSITVVPGGTGFSFAPNAAYVNTPTRLGFETWGVTPELTIKLGGSWQLRNSVHFGRSTNYQRFPGVNTILAQSYVNSGQLNPLNVAAASASVINDITNYEDAQDTNQQLFVLRSVADGSLFALPGGDAKLAVGIEFQDNSASSRLASGQVGSVAALPYMKAERNAKSVFAELSLPVASFADVSASVRYDNYSDFGATTNPNIGVTLKPTSWLKVYGHWNTSFNAPTALDDLNIGTGRFVCGIYVAGGTPSQRPTDPLSRDTSKQGTCAMVLQGSSPGLEPQTAKSWAVGFEAKPLAGLRFGGTVAMRFGRHGHRHAAAAVDIGARLLVAAEFQQAARLAFLDQIAEGAEAVIGLAEVRLAALDRLLQHGGPDLAAVAALQHQRFERIDGDFHRLVAALVHLFAAHALLFRRALDGRLGLAARFALGAAALAHQVVVEDEFVAVGHQQVRGRLLDADADHLLGVLAQLGHQRREIGITGDDDEGVDVRLGVAQVERVDHHADVGRVLAGLAHVRDFDQLEVGLVHGRLEALVAVPVAVRLLDHDAALEQQTFQHRLDVELVVVGVAHTERHVFKIAEQRHADVIVGRCHEEYFSSEE